MSKPGTIKVSELRLRPVLMDIDNLAKYVCLSKAHLYKLVHFEKIPHVKLGSALRFRIDAIDRWINRHEEKSVVNELAKNIYTSGRMEKE